MTTPQDPAGQQPGQSWPVPPSSGYPGATPPSAGGWVAGQSGPPAQRPKEVDISFWLWVTSIVLGLVGLLFFVGQFDTIRDTVLDEVRRQAQRQGETLNEQELQSFASAALAVAVTFSLLFAAGQLLLASLMRKGRNWARIVLAVLGGFIALSRLLSLGAEPGGPSVLAGVGLIVLIGAIVTMFLPAANPWFWPRPKI